MAEQERVPGGDQPLDLVWGAKAIAAELGLPTRKAFYLLERQLVPAKKVGKIWVASRRAIRRHLIGEVAA